MNFARSCAPSQESIGLGSPSLKVRASQEHIQIHAALLNAGCQDEED